MNVAYNKIKGFQLKWWKKKIEHCMFLIDSTLCCAHIIRVFNIYLLFSCIYMSVRHVTYTYPRTYKYLCSSYTVLLLKISAFCNILGQYFTIVNLHACILQLQQIYRATFIIVISTYQVSFCIFFSDKPYYLFIISIR